MSVSNDNSPSKETGGRMSRYLNPCLLAQKLWAGLTAAPPGKALLFCHLSWISHFGAHFTDLWNKSAWQSFFNIYLIKSKLNDISYYSSLICKEWKLPSKLNWVKEDSGSTKHHMSWMLSIMSIGFNFSVWKLELNNIFLKSQQHLKNYCNNTRPVSTCLNAFSCQA